MDKNILIDARGILDSLIERCWLDRVYFEISDDVLESSLEYFRDDYRRWFGADGEFSISKILFVPQLIALLCYRIARTVYTLSSSTAGTLCPHIADAYSLLGRQYGQIEIYYSALIGRGLKINHGVGTVIGARCVIGDNCMIHQNCTVGDKDGGRPKIGNNVTIYAGSMILGNIEIGDNCTIGANSVVMCDCPPGSIVVGSPAKIIRSSNDELHSLYPDNAS